MKMEFSPFAAVTIRNGFKRYHVAKSDGVPVLSDFSMTVPQGSIYSLLGSSGSGKTTILSCIVGLAKLDSGTISVFGGNNAPAGSRRVHKIGYMPQEISLYESLSISETLLYFGEMSSVEETSATKTYLKERIRFLTTLLHLPHGGRIVGTLSGGQRKRLSFAVAIINEPKLLILDEPTSGVDPLIRECIWNYLKDLTALNGTTVILTTHYVDEAKACDIVGVMLEGRMTAEQSPKSLLEMHDTNSLETAFLNIARAQPKCNSSPPLTLLANSDFNLTSEINFHDYGNGMSKIFTMMGKNYKCMFRNVWMLAFMTLTPPICMLVACITFQRNPHSIPFGIVNKDVVYGTNCSEFAQEAYCAMDEMSCQFLNDLPSASIKTIPFHSTEDAQSAVNEGRLWGYMYFPENYSSSVMQRFSMGGSLIIDGDVEGDTIWNNSIITVSMDQTNTLIYATIMQVLVETLERSHMRILSECGQDEHIGQFPLVYKEPIIGSNDFTSLNYVAPGLAIAILFFFPVTVAIRFIGEKRQGTMERCIVGGTQIWEILVAYAIPEFCILLIQSVLVFSIMRFGFSLGNYSVMCLEFAINAALVLSLCILTGLAGLTFGFLLGVACHDESQAALIIIATIFPSSFLSAVVWPVEGMPILLQAISPFFPMALPGEAMRSMMNRGWGILHPNVWSGFVVALLYVVVPFGLTIFMIRKRVWRN